MATQGDMKRPHSVKAQFDNDFEASAQGGAVLVERVLRRLDVRRLISQHLPARSSEATYTMENAVHALLGGLLVGGRGIKTGDVLRKDDILTEIFGLEQGAPSPATTSRVLCELAGLEQRKAKECYEPRGEELPSMEMFGELLEQAEAGRRKKPKRRRIVPETPEAATPEKREALDSFVSATARRCAKAMKRKVMQVRNWYVVFGDATDLEVEGNCFDAARPGRNNTKILRWQTLMLGPIIVGQQLQEGNADEGTTMPRLLEEGKETIREITGTRARVLALLDAAYFEKQVVDPLTNDMNYDFIIGANQMRTTLKRLAEEQPAFVWKDTGADERRGWTKSQVCAFTHTPGGWDHPVTIVARRWVEEGEMEDAWRYSFVGTRMKPADLPTKLLKEHGFCSSIWMLYGTKQGRENHYKTPLRDFGLHHPPSCRLGVNQALYALATVASNIAMVMRYRLPPAEDRGIAFWRMRGDYFGISGYLTRSGPFADGQPGWRKRCDFTPSPLATVFCRGRPSLARSCPRSFLCHPEPSANAKGLLPTVSRQHVSRAPRRRGVGSLWISILTKWLQKRIVTGKIGQAESMKGQGIG